MGQDRVKNKTAANSIPCPSGTFRDTVPNWQSQGLPRDRPPQMNRLFAFMQTTTFDLGMPQPGLMALAQGGLCVHGVAALPDLASTSPQTLGLRDMEERRS